LFAKSLGSICEHFYMALFVRNMSNLEELSSSSLAKHVQSFTFYTDAVPTFALHAQVTEREIWENAIDFREDMVPDVQMSTIAGVSVDTGTGSLRNFIRYNIARHHFSRQQLANGWGEYQALRKEQYIWLLEQTSLNFKACFVRLPNVVTVNVMSAADERPANKIPLWKMLRQRILIGPDEWRRKNGRQNVASFDLPGVAFLCVLEAIGLRAVLAETKPKFKQVTTLDARPHSLGPLRNLLCNLPFTAETFIQRDWDARYRFVRESFPRLTDLTLHMGTFCNNTRHPERDRRKADDILDLLFSAPRLKRLDFSYDNNAYLGPNFNNFEATFVASLPHWPDIEELGLSISNMHHNQLLKLLQLNAARLRSLELSYMWVKNARVLFTQMPKILNLEKASFRIIHLTAMCVRIKIGYSILIAT